MLDKFKILLVIHMMIDEYFYCYVESSMIILLHHVCTYDHQLVINMISSKEDRIFIFEWNLFLLLR